MSTRKSPFDVMHMWADSRLALAILPCWLVQGCVSDTQRLADSATPAVETVIQRATTELSCPETTESIRSQRVVQGAPLGYLWNGYVVDASGCGRRSIYEVICLNEQQCSADKL